MPDTYPRNKCIPEILAEVARRDPDRTALVHGPRRLTYGRLEKLSDRLAAMLRSGGMAVGDRVAVLADRTVETIVAYVAILKAGGAYVPVDSSLPAQRIAFTLDDCTPCAVLTQRAHRGRLDDRALPIIELDDLEAIPSWPSPAPPAVKATGSAADPGDLAYILYTSGTTGTPKGVAVPHRAVVRLVFAQDYARFGPERTFLQLASLSFDAATLEIWGPLLHGGTCVLYPGGSLPDPAQLQRTIEENGITTCWLTASLFNTIVNVMPEALAGLEELLIGGEALSVTHVRRALSLLPGVQIINGYGPTENTTFTCCYRIPRELPPDQGSVPIGHPIAHTQVYILDENRAPVADGKTGEIYCGGDGLAVGYWNRPDLTHEAFVVPDHPGLPHVRLYRTGDFGCLLPDGAVEFQGRRDDQIKIRGYRIEPGEITAVLQRHERVREAAVVVQQETDGAKYLAAYIVPQSGEPTPEEMRRYLGEHLGDYMIPAFIACLPALPLNASGKLDRSRLPRPSPSGPARGGLVPGNECERILASIWSRLLNTEPIGVDLNFFEAGGTSLLSIELISEIDAAFAPATPLSVVQVYQHPTIRDFAAFLSGSGQTASAGLSAQERAARQKRAFRRNPRRQP